MANVRWKGAAVPVAQVNTITPAGVSVGNTFTVTINSKSISYTAAAATAADVCNGLQALLAASTIPEFTEITWTTDGTKITGTSAAAGVPFTQTSSATGGTASLTTATATANSGPNNWDVAANWSTGAVPVTGDTVYIEDSAVSIQYGLGQAAVTLAALNVAASFTGDIGLPETNTRGSGPYLEYRAQYLAIGATAVNIGYGPGQGSSRIKLDAGAVLTTLNVSNTAQGAEQNLEAIQWKSNLAIANVVNINKGSIALAGYGGDVASVATLTVGFLTSQNTDAQVRGGPGLALTTLQQNGGQVELAAGLTTVSKTAGSLVIDAGSVTTITDDSGSTTYKGIGTIGTANVGNGATLDFSQDMRGRTVTTCNLYAGAAVLDPFATVTFTNAVHLLRCGLRDVTLEVGKNRNLTVT